MAITLINAFRWHSRTHVACHVGASPDLIESLMKKSRGHTPVTFPAVRVIDEGHRSRCGHRKFEEFCIYVVAGQCHTHHPGAPSPPAPHTAPPPDWFIRGKLKYRE